MISDCKLKVMLGEDDLKQFEIKAEQLDYSNTETKRMFWDILNRAKHQTGFDTDGQRVLVPLYPSKQGGCEMFVTKIGLLYSEDEDDISRYNYEEKKNSKTFQTKKEKKHIHNVKMQRIFFVCTVAYVLFFACLLKLINPVKDIIRDISLGFQGLIIIFAMLGIKQMLKKAAKKVEMLKNKVLSETLLVYAFIWMIITFVLINDLPKDMFDFVG